MAINPQLLMILMQQAPGLLRALQSKFDNGGPLDGKTPLDTNTQDVLNELVVNRQYDPALMEGRMYGDTPDVADYVVNAGYGRDLVGEHKFPSDYTGDPSLSNLFKQLTTEQRQAIGGAPASLSAATFLSYPPQVDSNYSIGDLYAQVRNDYRNGEYADNGLGIIDPYTVPNPATGMSQEDWDFDEVDDAADNPYAKKALLEKILKNRRK